MTQVSFLDIHLYLYSDRLFLKDLPYKVHVAYYKK